MSRKSSGSGSTCAGIIGRTLSHSDTAVFIEHQLSADGLIQDPTIRKKISQESVLHYVTIKEAMRRYLQ